MTQVLTADQIKRMKAIIEREKSREHPKYPLLARAEASLKAGKVMADKYLYAGSPEYFEITDND